MVSRYFACVSSLFPSKVLYHDTVLYSNLQGGVAPCGVLRSPASEWPGVLVTHAHPWTPSHLSGAGSLEVEPRNMHVRFKTLGAGSVSPYVPPFKEVPRICLSTVIDYRIYISDVHTQSKCRSTVGKSHSGANHAYRSNSVWRLKSSTLSGDPALPLLGNVPLSKWLNLFKPQLLTCKMGKLTVPNSESCCGELN